MFNEAGGIAMFYIIRHNTSGWYYDLLDEDGCEVGCYPYFLTYDAAKRHAEATVTKLLMGAAA